MKIVKYSSTFLSLIDLFCTISTLPWLSILSLFLGCYWSTTYERKRPWKKVIPYAIYGPILGLFVAFLFPFAVVGYLVWIVTCNVFHIPDYAIVSFPEENVKSGAGVGSKSQFTFVSANLLLGIESVGKFQNMPFVYNRLSKIGKTFALINDKLSEPISNAPILNDTRIEDEELMDTVVSDHWPQVDFFCFQEVWDRYFTLSLIQELRKSNFNYFCVDVARQSWHINHYFGSSGLMLASRYPIIEASFHPHRHKCWLWQKMIPQGILVVKVDLGGQKVGYLANLHNVAYQGDEDLICPSMDDSQKFFNDFRKNTLKPNEEESFAIIAGDFNFDNISPGDSPMQNHKIFEQFHDFCSIRPGEDKPWTVGTEHRQLQIYEPEFETAKAMKQMMVDHLKRRYFIIDANISEQTFDLMYCQPEADEDGEVRPKKYGGRRRIDRILTDQPAKIEGYQFLTCLAGQTDHVPVAMTIKC